MGAFAFALRCIKEICPSINEATLNRGADSSEESCSRRVGLDYILQDSPDGWATVFKTATIRCSFQRSCKSVPCRYFAWPCFSSNIGGDARAELARLKSTEERICAKRAAIDVETSLLPQSSRKHIEDYFFMLRPPSNCWL